MGFNERTSMVIFSNRSLASQRSITEYTPAPYQTKRLIILTAQLIRAVMKIASIYSRL